MQLGRRGFFQIAAATAAPPVATPPRPSAVQWPRKFTGQHLAQIAFPLGGIAAGSVSLGGRGQLRDWEIFNRPDKGNAPNYALPSIWAQVAGRKSVALVAEAKYLPPYEGPTGLGSNNAPGLPRLDSATFTGQYPIARIDFRDRRLPLRLSLEAFTPIFPLDADASGLPAAVLRYHVKNPNSAPARVALSWSLDNMVGTGEERLNEIRESARLRGVLMSNPKLAAEHPLKGTLALAALAGGEVSIWRGWPKGRWWNSPMLFWDEFSAKGRLETEPDPRNAVATVCIGKELAAGGEADLTFVLAWHFPNRTPERCGWRAPKGDEKTVIGNWYCQQHADAWAAAESLARDLPGLEAKTRAFVRTVAESTLPGAVKDAAMSNLSTLATTTSFRTADGEFHGFEGVNDKAGCCFGSCTHVWNYETSTALLFPTLSRSLRQAAFGWAMDERGAMHFREVLPAGKERSSIVAADGQWGQIMKVYLDYHLSGDRAWLAGIWPRVQKALEFAWYPGSWDADRDGVAEGVQHNTYDVEFYGPNPQCGIYYLGALRACEEMARALDDSAYAARCRALFEAGSHWIDANLFTGEFYIQKVQGARRESVAKDLISDMGSDASEQPEYQVGDGCLLDQLIGQYQAEACGLGPLVSEANIRKTLGSIYRYNYKRDMGVHESVQRIFALNDEAALVLCDYGKGTRPRIPFPYYAELFTGIEYTTAAQFIYAGMTAEGIECIDNIRQRYDGLRRNPWNEAECGHHYARAMAAWSGLLALSGFHYDAPARRLDIRPARRSARFRSFWSTAGAWGWFELGVKLTIHVEQGTLTLAEVRLKSRTIQPASPIILRSGTTWTG